MTTPEIQAHFDRGRAYVESGDYDRAIVELTQAIELTESAKRDPFRAEFYAWRGLAYHYKGDYDYAMDDLTMATLWKGNDYSEAFAVRAEIALKIKDYGSAVRHFREAKARKKARQEGDSTQGLFDSMSISYTHTPRFRQTYMELVEQEELYKLYEPPWTRAKMLKRLEIRQKEERELQEREQREAGKDRLEVLNERLKENPYSLADLLSRSRYYEKMGEDEKASRDRERYYNLGGQLRICIDENLRDHRRTLWKWQRLDEKMGAIQNASQEVKRNYDLSGEMAKITIPATRADLAHVGPPLIEQPLQPVIE